MNIFSFFISALLVILTSCRTELKPTPQYVIKVVDHDRVELFSIKTGLSTGVYGQNITYNDSFAVVVYKPTTYTDMRGEIKKTATNFVGYKKEKNKWALVGSYDCPDSLELRPNCIILHENGNPYKIE